MQKKEKDYTRSIGKLVDVKLYKPLEKVKELTGVLKDFDNVTVTIETDSGEYKTIDRTNIAKISLAFCD